MPHSAVCIYSNVPVCGTITHMFDERKAAQAAAYLLHRAGGELELLKLMKLMYLAERRSFEAYGEPLTGDALVAMPHGPVLSAALDHANDFVPHAVGGWNHWISGRAGNRIGLRDPTMLHDPQIDLLQLSDSDLDVLAQVWDQFGGMTAWQIRNFTHDQLPEWKDPEGGALPIRPGDLLRVLGKSRQEADAILVRLFERDLLSRNLST